MNLVVGSVRENWMLFIFVYSILMEVYTIYSRSMNDKYDTHKNPHINARFEKQHIFIGLVKLYSWSVLMLTSHIVYFSTKESI